LHDLSVKFKAMQFFLATTVSAWVSASIRDTNLAFSNFSFWAMDEMPCVMTFDAVIVHVLGVTCRQRIQPVQSRSALTWGLSIAQTALTLKATTRHLLQSALMPLARRCQADQMFQTNWLQGTWATDVMDMRSTSIHNEKHCQVFSHNDFFAAACPIKKKGDCHQALDDFAQDFGVVDLLISDGAAEALRNQCRVST
jgi:hypothetical protein